MNNIKRFDGKSEIYAKSRPKYASGLFEYMQREPGIPQHAVFADIGSGTGIFTEQLLERGYTVYAVEPNEDMRRKAEEKLADYAGFHSVNGKDSRTTLPCHSVDCITLAQAFHWFDAAAFKTECHRILRDGGRIMLIYNSRDEEAECTRALASLRKKYSGEFKGFSNGISDDDCRAFFGYRCDVLRWDNSLTYDRAGYINRLLSSSYSPAANDPRFEEYIADIGKLFDNFSSNGRITVPTNTVLYTGSPG